jgi:hypothetical protein
MTDGRGPISVIDAVGMEAHGAPVGKLAHRMTGFLPDAVAPKMIETAGIDPLNALHTAIELVQRRGTISLSDVYGGAASPMPLIQMFDKQINLRMGQVNVRRWVGDILPLGCWDDDARRRGLRDARRPARRRAQGVRDVPEEGGRRVQGAAEVMKAICLNCTLKRSPEESSTAALADVVIRAARRGVETDAIRLIDHRIDVLVGDLRRRRDADRVQPRRGRRGRRQRARRASLHLGDQRRADRHRLHDPGADVDVLEQGAESRRGGMVDDRRARIVDHHRPDRRPQPPRSRTRPARAPDPGAPRGS